MGGIFKTKFPDRKLWKLLIRFNPLPEILEIINCCPGNELPDYSRGMEALKTTELKSEGNWQLSEGGGPPKFTYLLTYLLTFLTDLTVTFDY